MQQEFQKEARAHEFETARGLLRGISGRKGKWEII